MTTHTDFTALRSALPTESVNPNGAEVRFRQTTGSNVNPAQTSEPGIITMPDGSERRITLEIKVNGAWKKVDPKHIPYQAIAEQCHKIYRTTMQATDLPETL